MRLAIATAAVLISTVGAFGQSASVYTAPTIAFPAPIVDGNSPGVWVNGELKVYTSTGSPLKMKGPAVAALSNDADPIITSHDHFPIWIESVWRDDDGTIYAWYHHEPRICEHLANPEIGALVSTDGGEVFTDLGIILSSGDPANCSAQNGFFSGGHGDISVVLDRDRQYFYFVFTNYGGAPETQGISVARMRFEDRAQPVGAVYKFAHGEWTEPGLGGAVTPVVPARVPWEEASTDSYWGPAIHWNYAIDRYVILLNHACCEPGWPQEGIYIMYAEDLSNPLTWTSPVRLLGADQIGFAPGFYPQVFGSGVGDTDSVAGRMPRLFIKGVSKWLIYFSNDAAEYEDSSGHSD